MSIETVMNELAKKREEQLVKWQYTYTVSGVIQNAQTTALTITIDQSHNFFCEYITGRFWGPTNSSGIYQSVGGAGVPSSNFPNPDNVKFASSGISVKLVDQGAGIEIDNDYVPAELKYTPGYGVQFFQPMKFHYLFKQNSVVRFEVRNRDTFATGGTYYHQAEFAMQGWKYLAVIK